LALDGIGWLVPWRGHFIPGNDLVPVGGWLGLRTGLDRCKKSLSHQDSIPTLPSL